MYLSVVLFLRSTTHVSLSVGSTYKLFHQMYSIHGSIRGKKLPLLYSLLVNKDQETCEELFRIVAQHVQRKLDFITIDFQKQQKMPLILHILNVKYLDANFPF